jgi:hypothetical protein
VDIPPGFQLVKTGGQILVGEIHIFRLQQVNEFEITSICHLVNDTLERLCHSRHCYHQDLFKS